MVDTIINDERLNHWMVVAYYPRNGRHGEVKGNCRDLIAPDDAIMEMQEARNLWERGFLLMANRFFPDRVEIIVMRSSRVMASAEDMILNASAPEGVLK